MFDLLLPKVQVVDDDPAVCEFLKLAIAPQAARVDVAENATTALEAVENGDFDIILCDIWMPGCSGMELLSLARQSQWDVGSSWPPAKSTSSNPGQGDYVPSSAVCNSVFLCLGGLCLRLLCLWVGGGDPISVRARRLTSLLARKGFGFRKLIQDHPVAYPHLRR
jgi:CheY-like chemotaxis protein